jgi:hypothetical protein
LIIAKARAELRLWDVIELPDNKRAALPAGLPDASGVIRRSHRQAAQGQSSHRAAGEQRSLLPIANYIP